MDSEDGVEEWYVGGSVRRGPEGPGSGVVLSFTLVETTSRKDRTVEEFSDSRDRPPEVGR